MKKILTGILAVVCLFTSVCFFGCKKKGPIPNGSYYMQGEDIFVFTENSIRTTHGLEIEGDTAQFWVSSYVYYKAKIVVKDGEIYFEGYKWRDTLYFFTSCSTKKEGSEDDYKVRYDETEKSITLTLLDISLRG